VQLAYIPIVKERVGFSLFLGGIGRGQAHAIVCAIDIDSMVSESRLTAGSPTAPALADKVSDAWLAFARAGNPSTTKLPAWPPYDAGKRATMVFDDVSAVAEDPIGAERAVMFEALY